MKCSLKNLMDTYIPDFTKVVLLLLLQKIKSIHIKSNQIFIVVSDLKLHTILKIIEQNEIKLYISSFFSVIDTHTYTHKITKG